MESAIAASAPRPFRWSRAAGVAEAIRVFPSQADPTTVFVWTRGGLLVSKDGGKTFAARPPEATSAFGSLTALLVNPARTATLYAGTAEKGVFVSTDEGASWRPLGGTDKGLASPRIHSLVFSPSDPGFTTLFATHSTQQPGISMTFDGGETWRSFAKDYGAGDLIIRSTHIFFAGAHPAGGQETGFYRSMDAGNKWFRVLNVENPTVLAAGRAGARRAWCGSATSGLYVTDDFGVSTRAVGPQAGLSVAAVAVGFQAPGAEAVYVYDPNGLGVLASTDDFATWEKLNDGLYVGSWVAQGATLAAALDGSALYACVNGALYRGARAAGPLGLSAIRVEPAAVCAGEGSATATCRAAKGAEVSIDLSPVGGPASVPMADDGNGLFTARIEVPASVLTPPKDYKGPPIPGQLALALRASKGNDSETGLAVLHVLANPADLVLWDGDERSTFAAWSKDGMTVGLSKDRPLSGAAHVRVQVSGPGVGGASWKTGWWDGDDTRAHKLFCFEIRSDREGPSDLRVALRDDGRKYGHGEGARSNELPIARYLPKLSTRYQYVAIPLADFIWGAGAVPEAICELMFIAPANEQRTYDVDDIGLAVRPGPRLAGAQAALLPDGKAVRLSVRVRSVAGKVGGVAVAVGSKTIPLQPDAEVGEGCYAATVPASDLGAGLRTLRFSAQDSDGSRETSLRAFLPRRLPGQIARASGPIKRDGELSEFQDVAPFVLSQGPLSLTARILHGERSLWFALEVKDPAYVPQKPPRDLKLEALAAGPSVEVIITSPTTAMAAPRSEPSAADHRIVFAAFDKRAYAVLKTHRWEAAMATVSGGYAIEAQVPFDALRAEHSNCDFDVGRSTRIELRLNGADGTKLAWAAPSAKDSDNPENWGLVCFTEEAGPPRIRLERCNGATLTLASNKRLDPRLGPGVAQASCLWPTGWKPVPLKAEFGGDGRLLQLTASEPWRVGQRVTVKFPGLRAADGAAAQGQLDFAVLPGRAVSETPLQEFLIGEAQQGIDPKTVLQQDIIPPSLRPSAGAEWRLVRSDTGSFRLYDLVGAWNNAIAHACTYVFSDADRSVQLWFASDDGVRATLNGTTLYTNVTSAAGMDRQRVKDVRLAKGWNTLLLAISQGGGDWGFGVRIVGEDGKEPPSGVSYSAESPFGPMKVVRKEPSGERVGEASTADVVVEKTNYLGWKGAWRLRNRACELVVVPQISRVMHFAPRDGENLLYVNRALAGGAVPKDDVQWHNFGGDKVWPTAQSLWEKYTGRKGWPPPYHFDCAPSAVEPVRGGVRLIGALCPHFGARCVREFTLDRDRPLVRVRQLHEKVGDRPAEMTLWSIAQVRKPLFALLPVEGGAREGRYKALGKLVEPLFAVHQSVLSLRNHDTEGQKVGVLPDAAAGDGWVAAVYDKLLLVQSHKLEKGAAYPDGGCHAELFTAAQGMDSYVELELLSPLRELKAGDTLRDDAVWQIVPLAAGQGDDPERAAAAARAAHKAALDVLTKR